MTLEFIKFVFALGVENTPISQSLTNIMVEQYKYLDAFIDEQRSNGKYSFTTLGLHRQLGVSENALKKSLQRLKSRKAVAIVRRGFYVIVPPEYRVKGIIPTSFYVNDLLKFLNRDYYVGLLNAAAYHGAAHQQPQSFAVITEGISLRPIKNELVSIDFFIRKSWDKSGIMKRKVETGYMNISTPELTALDLVNYYYEVGGFSRVATVLDELREVMDGEVLAVAARQYDQVVVAQRLGYLLDYHLNDIELSDALYQYLESIEYYPALLRAQKEKSVHMKTGNRWKIVPNIEIESDL